MYLFHFHFVSCHVLVINHSHTTFIDPINTTGMVSKENSALLRKLTPPSLLIIHAFKGNKKQTLLSKQDTLVHNITNTVSRLLL